MWLLMQILYSGGKIVVIGSGQIFSDKYIDKENNDKLREMFITFLTSNEKIKLNPSEHDDIDVSDF